MQVGVAQLSEHSGEKQVFLYCRPATTRTAQTTIRRLYLSWVHRNPSTIHLPSDNTQYNAMQCNARKQKHGSRQLKINALKSCHCIVIGKLHLSAYNVLYVMQWCTQGNVMQFKTTVQCTEKLKSCHCIAIGWLYWTFECTQLLTAQDTLSF